MSDKVKLIIEIPSIDYEYLKNNCIIPIKYDNHIYEAILNGTPLDTVKAEITALRYGSDTYKNAIDDVIEIIDSVGEGDK